MGMWPWGVTVPWGGGTGTVTLTMARLWGQAQWDTQGAKEPSAVTLAAPDLTATERSATATHILLIHSNKPIQCDPSWCVKDVSWQHLSNHILQQDKHKRLLYLSHGTHEKSSEIDLKGTYLRQKQSILAEALLKQPATEWHLVQQMI